MVEPITAMTCIADQDKFRCKVPQNQMYWSVKLDGVRTLACVYQSTVTFWSRNGKQFPNFDRFGPALQIMAAGLKDLRRGLADHPVWFDGEVISKDKQFSGVMQQLRRHKNVDSSVFEYHIFDCPSLGQYSLSYRICVVDFLVTQTKPEDIQYHVHYKAHDWDAIMRSYAGALHAGEEGIVVKDCTSLYENKRSSYWLKLKEDHTLDLPVVGRQKGKGKFAHTLGALECMYNGKKVTVSGFTDAQRNEFWENPPAMIEVQYQCITSQGSLRHPRFVRVRDDK